MYTTPGGGVLMEPTPSGQFAIVETNRPITQKSSDKSTQAQPTVVFIHNGGTSSTIWRHQVESFGRTHHVLAIDLPGFGCAPLPDTPLSLDELTTKVTRLIAERTDQPVVLVGNCMGSNIAAGIVASKQLPVVAMILINPLSEYTFQQGGLGFLHKFQKATPKIAAPVKKISRKITPPRALVPLVLRTQFGGRGRAQGLHHDPELTACFTRPEQLPALVDVLEDMSSYSRLDEPMSISGLVTGVIWGEKNRILAPASGGLINNWLQPDHVLTIKDTGHLAMLEAPQEVNGFIVSILDQVSTATPEPAVSSAAQ